MFALFATSIAYAQAPLKLNYQGVARDNVGIELANQAISLRFSIHQGNPTGLVSYVERHDAIITNQFGLFSVRIGDGFVISGSMTIDWAQGPYYFEVEMDANGGNNFISLGTSELISVPYALYAESSGTGGLPGPTGPTGDTGFAGETGPTGATGVAGPSGLNGIQGVTGPSGVNGSTGATGIAGNDGIDGITGPTGAQGVDGINGATGPMGAQGQIGITGATGVDGSTGPTGPTGGLNGITGSVGWTIRHNGTTWEGNSNIYNINNRVGINQTNPTAGFQVSNGDGILIQGILGNGASQTLTPGSYLWYSNRTGAFRVGSYSTNEWNNPNIGGQSFACCEDAIAKGLASVALNTNTESNGNYSFAANLATVTNSGSGASFGVNTLNNSYTNFVLGRYNIGSGTTDSWVLIDPIFEIGIGNGATSRANAFTVLKNGKVGIGQSQPTALLHIKGGDTYYETIGNGDVLKSPNGNCWKIVASDVGVISSVSISCY